MNQNIFSAVYQLINGQKFPKWWDTNNILSAINYINNYESNDLKIVISVPKSGTHWLRQIVFLLENNGKQPKSYEELLSETQLFEITLRFDRKTIFSHISLDSVPYNKNKKYLFVIRNPKDVFVSIYHFIINMKFSDANIYEIFNAWIDGDGLFGDCFKPIFDNWNLYKKVNDQNRVNLLIYERMKADPKSAVLTVGKFLGNEFEDKLLANNEMLLNEILKYSSIAYMKKPEIEMGPSVRLGECGDWRRHFTKEMSDKVDDKFNKIFGETELSEIWKDYMEWKD